MGLVSDTHLGFGVRSERENEAAENFRQALVLLVERQVDVIIHAGDFFDEDVPSQETWSRTFEAFEPLDATANSVIISGKATGGFQPLRVPHVPLVAIHGTHEYRGKGYANCVAVLGKAKKLVYVHGGVICIQKGAERIFIHGLGGVPEKKAREVLGVWNPQPEEGGLNVLVTHQSFLELLPFGDDMAASLSFADLPAGFDLYVNGHFHAPFQTTVDGRRFFIPGSTVVTQMKKNEAQNRKGVWVWDTAPDSLDFVPLPRQRELFYIPLVLSGDSPEKLLERMRQSILELRVQPREGLKPLVRFKVRGLLGKGFGTHDLNFGALERDFGEKLILSAGLSIQKTDGVGQKIGDWRKSQSDAPSIHQAAMALLEAALANGPLPMPLEELADLLENSVPEEILARLDPDSSG